MMRTLDKLLGCGIIDKIYFTEALKFQPRMVNKLTIKYFKSGYRDLLCDPTAQTSLKNDVIRERFL